MLTHERMRRWPGDASVNADGWGWDAISHYGGSIGNLETKANFGGEVRFGWKLPDDFGSTPLRPVGENTAPTRSGRPGGWSWHLFATSDAAWVIRDITLDGNTFRNSHSVDKRHVVAYGGYGVAVMYVPLEVRCRALPQHARIQRPARGAGIRQLHHQSCAVVRVSTAGRHTVKTN